MNLINLLRGRQNKKSERNYKNLEKLRNLGINKELSTYKVSTIFQFNFKGYHHQLTISTRKESYKIFRIFFRIMLPLYQHKSYGKSRFRADFDFRLHGRIPTVKLKIPGKSIFEIRNQNFCYIQVLALTLRQLKLSISGSGWDLASTLPCTKCEKHLLIFGFQKCFFPEFSTSGSYSIVHLY